MRHVVTGLSLALGLAFLALPTPAAQPSRPNVVLILLDDQDAFTPYWDAMPVAADLLRDRGVVFRHAFSTTPICAPGRVTLLSGRLGHNTGVLTLVGPYGLGNFAGQLNRTVAVELDRLGYASAMIGKSWGGDRFQPGWDYWCALTGDRLYEGSGYRVIENSRQGLARTYSSGKYSTDFIAEKAAAYLRGRATDATPVFLWLSPTAPHLPLPPAARHAREARARWRGRLPIRPNFNEPDIADKSAWLRGSAATRSRAVSYARGEYASRMGSLRAVDEMLARIRDVLVAQGKWDNTVVILTSDNGYNLGSHRLIHKQAPYEESIRVPLVIAGAGIPPGEVSRLVGLHDIAPTLIELAGGTPPADLDGRSLAPFLDSPEADITWRDAILTEYVGGYVRPGYNPGGAARDGYALDLPSYRSVRTETAKYVLWLRTGEEEVYDLVSDPDELDNLVRVDPARAASLLPGLRTRLALLGPCAGTTCP